jgi:hypothetical protein
MAFERLLWRSVDIQAKDSQFMIGQRDGKFAKTESLPVLGL